MSLAQSLAEILNKMGGKVKTGGEDAILAEIADTYEADKPELPAVTADDNGKVLAVVEGEWDKSTPVVPLVVELQPNDDALTTDVSNSDILNAINTNRPIRFVRISPDRYFDCYLSMYRVLSSTVYIDIYELSTTYKYQSAGGMSDNALFIKAE